MNKSTTTTEGFVPMPGSMEQLKLLLLRWNALHNKGVTDENHAEFKELTRILKNVAKQQHDYEERLSTLKSGRKNGVKLDTSLLRHQVQSFKLLSHNIDIPEDLQATLKQTGSLASNGNGSTNGNGHANGNSNGNGNGSGNHVRTLDYDDFEAREREATENHVELPFNRSHTHKNCSVGGVSEQIIRNRLTHRIVELESLPANLGAFDVHNVDPVGSDDIRREADDLKMKALVELKALRLLTKQKALRQKIVTKLANTQEIEKVKNRSRYRLKKVQTAQELRLAEELERRQREEREKVEFNRKMAKVRVINAHSQQMLSQYRSIKTRSISLGKVVGSIHREIEKEESKRSERTAKQRLQALRANDEEAYIKLLDQTKDTRITHLLSQTNSFLKSLSAAVRVQQQDAGVIEQDEEPDEDRDYYRTAHRLQEKVSKQPSLLVGGTLKEYQVRGLEWMVSLYNNNLNGILADEMGLGKTIQSISLITYLIEMKKQPGPYLVIVPLSTLTNWNMEFEKWAPTVKRVVYKGPPNARKGQQAVIRSGDFQVLLTTYEYIIKDRYLLSKIKWTHMIIDEGHRMKNTQSKLSSTLSTYYSARHRLILTGTPLQNNLPELWALLNFVLPKIFNSVKTFDEWFNTPFANTGGQDRIELTEEETLLIIRRLHKVLRPFLLRRLKKDVEKDLPDKVEKVIKCKMSALQSKLYDQMITHNVIYVGNKAANDSATKTSSVKGLNNKVMQLRKICNHPYVFEEVESIINPTKTNGPDLWRVAGKFELLDRILPKFKTTGHRVLMFFQMTQVMDIMEDFLRLRGLQYLRLDGSTKADERSDLLKLFNAPDSPYFAFLLSTRAGGLGLNLQTADTVIIYDTDWNPHQDLQAQDRAHRIGQTKEVRILRLITENSVEEQILERAQTKLEIDGKVIQAGKFDNKSTNEEQEAFLRSLLDAEEARRNGQSDEDDMDDDELNDILARNDGELEIFQQLDRERIEHGEYGRDKPKGERLMQVSELPEDYQQDIQEHLEPEKDEILGRGARERKSIMYDDGLTEEQWLDAVDDDNDTIEEAIARKNARKARREAKRMQDDEEDANGSFAMPEPEPEAAELADMPPPAPASSTKRKRRQSAKAAASATENGVENGSPSVGEDEEEDSRPAKRKARRSKVGASPGAAAPAQNDDLKPKVEKLIEAFNSVEDENGRPRSELFLQLPSKRDYPDYYQMITNPVALQTIQKKLKKKTYGGLDDVKADFDQMFANAKFYNQQGSLVYEDAEELARVVDETFSSLSAPAKSTRIRIKIPPKTTTPKAV